MSEEQDRIDLPHKQARSDVGPAEDLRLADQMVCLSVLSRVQDYTYWYFQFFSTGALLAMNISKGPSMPDMGWGGLCSAVVIRKWALRKGTPGRISGLPYVSTQSPEDSK